MNSFKPIEWQAFKNAIQDIRDKVFIQEQHVDQREEYDGLDELDSTHHFAAFDKNEKLIAYARLLGDGKIGRMAVLPNFRRCNIGSNLLFWVVDYALKNAVSNTKGLLYLYAQTQAKKFYEKSGFVSEGMIFVEAGIEHIAMIFDPQSSESITRLYRDRVLRFDNNEDIRHYLVSLTRCTSRHIDILSDHLEKPLFENNEFINALSQAARRSRRSRIRILLRDSKKLRGRSHALIDLAKRLNSKIEIRQITDDTIKPDIAYAVFDMKRLIYFNNENEHVGFANYKAAPEAEKVLDDFNNIWNHQAADDPNLRSLLL